MNICKIMMLGEMGVGKTSLTQQLKFGRIQGEYLSTVGFEVLTYEIEQGPGGVPFQFLIWDTDGSFGSAIFETVYLKGAQAAFFVGDVTRPATLNSLEDLSTRFEENLPGRYSALVLNKMDLLSPSTEVDLPESLTLSGRSIFRTSAKTGEGVRAAFEDAAETIVRRGLV
ncbi:MAG: Rab family GTPase [Pseudomonadota bacterium]